MPAGHHAAATPRIGGKLTVALFIVTLFAFVVESEFTQVGRPRRLTGTDAYLPVLVCSDRPWIQTTISYLVRQILNSALLIILIRLLATSFIRRSLSSSHSISYI